MSIVSDSNHWLFISSNGGLTAGRKNAEFALFPYYTDDKITEFADITGGNFCKLNSGEIFTKEEVNKYIAKKIEVFNIERQADVNLVARENGIELEQRLINKRSKNKKKLKEKLGFSLFLWNT